MEFRSAPGRKPKTGLAKKLALLGAATLCFVLLAEVVVRLFVDVPFAPFLKAYDPDNYARNKPNLSAWISRSEFQVKFTTNSLGFRSPEPPPSGKGCVLFLGDSFTEGWGVTDGEEYPALIQTALDERYGKGVVPVINASLTGAGNGRWVNMLQREFAAYEPRLVVFQTTWNDSRDNVFEKLFALSPSGELTRLPPPPPPFNRKIQPFLEAIPGLQHSRLFCLLRNMVREQGAVPEGFDPNASEPDPRPTLSDADRLFLALVEKSLSICAERRWRTAVISVMVSGPRFDEEKKLCARFDAPLLDIRDREQRPELYYVENGHWRPSGHRVLADRLLAEVLSADSPALADLK